MGQQRKHKQSVVMAVIIRRTGMPLLVGQLTNPLVSFRLLKSVVYNSFPSRIFVILDKTCYGMVIFILSTLVYKSVNAYLVCYFVFLFNSFRDKIHMHGGFFGNLNK